jgi:hypothetical protein
MKIIYFAIDYISFAFHFSKSSLFIPIERQEMPVPKSHFFRLNPNHSNLKLLAQQPY